MKKVFRFFANKYLITLGLFAAWMFLFDENNWLLLRERNHDLKATKENIAYLEKELIKEEKNYKDLISDAATLEKYAREKYRMKRDNEDVYTFERK